MKFRLLRPTLDTPFHVDWGWFERNNLNAESLIRDQLCYSCRQRLGEGLEVEEVDYIDAETGEVTRLDTLRECILSHCKWEPDYIESEVPLSQGVFRLFLANNNNPLTVVELAQGLQRQDPETILRLLTAGDVQYGVVPTRH